MASDPGETLAAEVAAEVQLRPDLEASWRLAEARIREAISGTYEAELEVLTDHPCPDPRELLGATLRCSFTRGTVVRWVHGIVREAEDLERRRDGTWALRLRVVPELWLLSHRRTSRIFSGLDLPRIVRRVLDEAGIYPGEALILALADGEVHRSREYCVQYQETDLDFLCRLLEEEGTCFYFRHEGHDRERLVVADADRRATDAAFPPVTSSHGASLPFVPPGARGVVGRESIQRFDARAQLASTSATLRDHDFTRYGSRELITHVRDDGAATPSLPVYEHPGRFVHEGLAPPESAMPTTTAMAAAVLGELALGAGGWLEGGATRLVDGRLEDTLRAVAQAPLPSYGRDDGARRSVVRLEQLRTAADLFRGAGDAVGFHPGLVFALSEHPRSALDREYLLTSVETRFRAPDDTHAGDGGHATFDNRFECVPREQPWRPPRRTPRPVIHGAQTATVVGGDGEEIHLDAYGRVRVQFHWDRQHACEENLAPTGASSGLVRDPSLLRWVRCAQSWAGPGWGSLFVPRVGMEVVCTFVDGDPDRPLVVGCVYNSANPPPYDLPREYHRSTIKSRSLPSAPGSTRDGFNELRFDDLSGHEEIFVHAEKDLTEVVRDHHETWVGGAQDLEVRRHQTARVGGSQHVVVAADRAVRVGGDQTLDVLGHHDLHVAGHVSTVAGGGRSSDVNDFDAEVVHGVHLHFVTPATGGNVATDVLYRDSMEAVSRILAARDAGGRYDPVSATLLMPSAANGGGDGDATGEDTPSQSAEGTAADTDAPVPLPLEVHVVRGDRLKRVDGLDENVAHEWSLATGAGRYACDEHLTTFGKSYAVIGEHPDVGESAGFLPVLQLDAEGARLRHGGAGLEARQSEVRVERTEQRLVMNGDGLELGSETETVRVWQKETANGLEVGDDGNRVKLHSAKGSELVIESDVLLKAKGKLTLSNDGGARIVLQSDGTVSIEGSRITLRGQVETS